MKLAANQAYFFPYVGYFALIEKVNIAILYENVSFRKKSWITRNRLYDKSNNREFFFSLQVAKKSSFKLIREIEIIDFGAWRKRFLNVLRHTYTRAMFFDEVYPLIESVLNQLQTNSLHKVNSITTQSICEALNISTEIICDNSHYLELERSLNDDHIDNLGLSKKESRVIALCKSENCNHYVNLPGGKQLYDFQVFESNRIKLSFLECSDETKSIIEKYDHEFQYSIIDTLMRIGFAATENLIKSYKLSTQRAHSLTHYA